MQDRGAGRRRRGHHSPLSALASANCFIVEGATPVFADVDPVTLNMDPAAVEAAVTERTRGIVAVDMFGYPCELDELRAIADRHGSALREDPASRSARDRGRPLGAHGPAAVFTFYPNKQMSTGEGGMIVTRSEEEWRLLRSLRNRGRSYDGGGGWFHHVRLGLNYRWTDVQAAIELGQSRSSTVSSNFATLPPRATESSWPRSRASSRRRPTMPSTAVAWFVYVVKLAPELDRAAVMDSLRRGDCDGGVCRLHSPAAVHA